MSGSGLHGSITDTWTTLMLSVRDEEGIYTNLTANHIGSDADPCECSPVAADCSPYLHDSHINSGNFVCSCTGDFAVSLVCEEHVVNRGGRSSKKTVRGHLSPRSSSKSRIVHRAAVASINKSKV